MVEVESTVVRWTDADGRSVRRDFVNEDLAARFAKRLEPMLRQTQADGYVFIEQQPDHDVDHPAAWLIAQQHLISVLEATFPSVRFEWSVTEEQDEEPVPMAGTLSWSAVEPDEPDGTTLP